MLRTLHIVLGSVAGAILLVGLAEILLAGRLSLIPPIFFGALVALTLIYLVQTLHAARDRGEALSRQASELKSIAGRLEASLRNAAAINTLLNQSEARYKGLVDAQGDAIFRRDASSRLTYGNDAFFSLFGLNPARALGHPFAPEPHPQSRAPVFGGFLESGESRARYDQHVKTADVLESGKHACLEAGMDGFLTKPVDPSALEEILRSLFPGDEASHIVAA